MNGFPAKLAAGHFHREIPVEEDDNNKMLLLNKMDKLDGEAMDDGAATNSPTPNVCPSAAVTTVTLTPRKRGHPHKQKGACKTMGSDTMNKGQRHGKLQPRKRVAAKYARSRARKAVAANPVSPQSLPGPISLPKRSTGEDQ